MHYLTTAFIRPNRERGALRPPVASSHIAGASVVPTKTSMSQTRPWAGPIGVALFALFFCQSIAHGQSGDPLLGDVRGAGWGRTPYNKATGRPSGPLPTPGSLLPHAGDYVSNETNYYEIVYMPLQTRIYVYDKKFRPMSAQEARAQMTLRLGMQASQQKLPFQFVSQPAGASDQDYLAANIDLRPLQGKAVSVTLELSYNAETSVMSPYYAHFDIRPYVAKALVTPADDEPISRQAKCPVTGAPLDSRGHVVKVYVAEFPLFLSSEDCIAAVKQNPQRFVPQAPPMSSLDR
jgi:hypothetical protein